MNKVKWLLTIAILISSYSICIAQKIYTAPVTTLKTDMVLVKPGLYRYTLSLSQKPLPPTSYDYMEIPFHFPGGKVNGGWIGAWGGDIAKNPEMMYWDIKLIISDPEDFIIYLNTKSHYFPQKPITIQVYFTFDE